MGLACSPGCQREYAYQWTPKHLASYPLFYDEPSHRARDFVMVSCLNATKDGGRCSNSAEGGRFWGSATVSLALVGALQLDGTAIKCVSSIM